MKIIKALVLSGRGPDYVSLTTDLPDPIPVEAGGGPCLHLDFKTPPGKGESYCREILGVTEVEVINT